MRIRVTLPLLALLLALTSVSACGSSEPLRVTGVQVGRTLNSDNSVGTITTRFKPDETIYASAHTTGAGSGTLSARWLYAGRVVSEAKKQVSYTREAATEFHIQNSAGFPAGDYTVQILLDGQQAAARDFRIE
jgi:hypothetical protein